MIELPRIVQSRQTRTAFIRLTAPGEKIGEVMGPGFNELMAVLEAQGMAPAGPWFNRYVVMDPAMFDFELSVPVGSSVSPSGRVQPGELPVTTVARTVYHGPYEGLPGAWAEFDDWIASQGIATAGDFWEVYAVGPETSADPASWRTELSRPVRQV